MYTHENVNRDDWTETQSGNYSAWLGHDTPLATVFCNDDVWRIVIDTDIGGRVVVGSYEDPEDAISRATDILNGADHEFIPERNFRRSATPWTRQKKTHNGSPTYGRATQDGMSLSVKKASSGKWYYTKYCGMTINPPVGWFNSAEEACDAADKANPYLANHQSFWRP